VKIKAMLGPIFSVSRYFTDILARKASQPKQTFPVGQCPSTEAALSRSVSEDAKHFWRPDPTEEQWKGVFRACNVSLNDAMHVQAVRHRPKNRTGEGIGSGITSNMAANAVQAMLENRGVSLSATEKESVVKYFYYMSTPEAPITAEGVSVIRAFNDLMERNGLLEKVR
jgi:hypothetical protein